MPSKVYFILCYISGLVFLACYFLTVRIIHTSTHACTHILNYYLYLDYSSGTSENMVWEKYKKVGPTDMVNEMQ